MWRLLIGQLMRQTASGERIGVRIATSMKRGMHIRFTAAG